MKILKGNYGECRFCDNMDQDHGLPSLEEKSWDLCLTDPPYNLQRSDGKIRSTSKKSQLYDQFKISYSDNMPEKEYYKWCDSWMDESVLKSNIYIFTPGYKNFKHYILKYPLIEMAIYYDITTQGGCKIASFRKWEPILCLGIGDHRKQHKRFKFAIFEEMNTYNYTDLNHPCPKNINLWQRIIRELKPSSVIDPFLGSGTTAEVCESLGIPWLGFELMEEYSPDIEKRIQRGILKKKHAKKQQTLFPVNK